ncbi:MAG: hypothetical protein JXX28_14680 [Deltaproteobacteria bacterium]|nr:hypothetical protein [Deltaproteobacteria bacterium]
MHRLIALIGLAACTPELTGTYAIIALERDGVSLHGPLTEGYLDALGCPATTVTDYRLLFEEDGEVVLDLFQLTSRPDGSTVDSSSLLHGTWEAEDADRISLSFAGLDLPCVAGDALRCELGEDTLVFAPLDR